MSLICFVNFYPLVFKPSMYEDLFLHMHQKSCQKVSFHHSRWSGGAMVLCNLPVPGRPTIWITVGQGPAALAVGADGVVWTFYSYLSFLSSFSRSLGDGPI